MTARDNLKSEINSYFKSYEGESITTEFDDLLDAYRDEVRREIVEDLYAKSWEVHDEEHFGFISAIAELDPGIFNRVNEENKRRQSESGTS